MATSLQQQQQQRQQRQHGNRSTPFIASTYQSRIRRQRVREHMIVFAQTFSPDGVFLVAANNCGQIAIWNIRDALARTGSTDEAMVAAYSVLERQQEQQMMMMVGDDDDDDEGCDYGIYDVQQQQQQLNRGSGGSSDRQKPPSPTVTATVGHDGTSMILKDNKNFNNTNTAATTVAATDNMYMKNTNINQYMNGDDDDDVDIEGEGNERRPILLFNAHSGPIYSTIFAGEGDDCVLVTAGNEVRVWRWSRIVELCTDDTMTLSMRSLSDVRVSAMDAMVGEIRPGTGDVGSFRVDEPPETNEVAVEYDTSSSSIYLACGDGNAYKWDVNARKEIRSYIGHTGYLHCIAARRSHGLVVTGGDEGVVRLWDDRVKQSTHVLSSAKSTGKSSSSITSEGGNGAGGFVSCVAVDDVDNWLAFGGSEAHLSLYHLPSLVHIGEFGLPTHTRAGISVPTQPRRVAFNSRGLLAVGNGPMVVQWTMDGALKSAVPSLLPSLYDVATNRKDGLLTVGGVGSQIDLFTSVGYRALALQFY